MRRAGSPAMQGWPRGGRGRSRAAAMVIGAAAGGGEEQLRFVRPAAFQHAGVGGGTEARSAEPMTSSACSGTAWLDGDRDGGERRPNGGLSARLGLARAAGEEEGAGGEERAAGGAPYRPRRRGARRRRAAVGDTAMVVVAPVPATVAHSEGDCPFAKNPPVHFPFSCFLYLFESASFF